MSILFGNSGVKNVKEIYIGVDGKPRKVKEGYIGVDGKPRLFYKSGPVALSSFDVGSLVYIKEYGDYLWPYIVSGHEYDISKLFEGIKSSSVLVRQEALEKVTAGELNAAMAEFESDLDPEVLALLPSDFPVFYLTLEMLDLYLRDYFALGFAVLPNANDLKTYDQWLLNTRIESPNNRIKYTYRAYTDWSGTPGEVLASSTSPIAPGSDDTHGFRPVLFLPGETKFDPGTGEFVGA